MDVGTPDTVNDSKSDTKVDEVKSMTVDDTVTEQEYDTRSEAGSSNSCSQSGSASPDLSSLADEDSVAGDDNNEDIYANFGTVHLLYHSCCINNFSYIWD